MKVLVGEKEIETQIMAKEKAEQKYDDAVAWGHTAAKASYDEEVPDVLNLNIGSLQPEARASVTVNVVTKLNTVSGEFYNLLFPASFLPTELGSNPSMTFRVAITALSEIDQMHSTHEMNVSQAEGKVMVLDYTGVVEGKDF